MSDQQPEDHFERRRDYKSVELTIDERVRYVERCVRRWIIRGIIGFAIIGVTCAVALAGYGYLLREQHQNAIELCENQNIRHDNALLALKLGSDQDQKNATSEAARAEIRRRRDVTIGIINGISPKIDCENPEPVKRMEAPK